MLRRFDRRGATLFALAAGIVTLATLIPAAAEGQAADSVHACYVTLSGTIYRIRAAKAPSTCTSPEHVAFSLTSSSQAKAPGGGSGGPTSDHGSLIGLLDDDHPQYLLTDGARTSTSGFAVTGALGTGIIPVTGPGARFMWYSGKAALRAR